MKLEQLPPICTCSLCTSFLDRFHETWVCSRETISPPSFLVKRARSKRGECLEIGLVQKTTIPSYCFQYCKSGAGFYRYLSNILHRKDITTVQKRKIISDSALVLLMTNCLPRPFFFWLRVCWRGGGTRWTRYLKINTTSGEITRLRMCDPSLSQHLFSCARDKVFLDKEKKQTYFLTSAHFHKEAKLPIPCWRIVDSLQFSDTD